MALPKEELVNLVLQYVGIEHRNEVESALSGFDGVDVEDDPCTDHLTLFGSELATLVSGFSSEPRGSEGACICVHNMAAILVHL